MSHDRIRVVQERGCDGRVRVFVQHLLLLPISRRFRRRDHVRFDIKAVQWEINRRVHLLRTLILPRREPFEMYDEELRSAGDDDLLGGIALTLAVRALPAFVPAQPLLLAVAPQAIVDICAFALLRDLDADAVKGFVSRGGVLAGGATETAGVLAREEVGDEGGFAVGVALPFDPGDFLNRHALAG